MTMLAPEVTRFLSTPRKMLIDGQWVDSSSGQVLAVENPSSGKVIGHVPAGTPADVDAAVQAARRSFARRTWRGLPADERAAVLWKLSDLLQAHGEEFFQLDVLDNGMAGNFARAVVKGGVGILRYYAGMCTKLAGTTTQMGGDLDFHAYSLREPVGVAALITPWNGPLLSACGKIAPALAAGCSVVLKPAELTSMSALRLGELALQAGVPPGVLNIVTGTGPVVGAALVEHADVNKVSFTGSTGVGKGIIAAAAGNMKRVTLELGGKSPVFIFDDADLARAIPAAAMAIFNNSGQICFAGSRLYVHRNVHAQVLEGIAAFARQLRLGSGLDSSTDMGPLISRQQRSRVLSFVQEAVADGAQVVTGGKAFGEQGYFMEPTILAGVQPQMRVMKDEIFGPVLSVASFDGIDEVEALGNDTPYGLGAGIFTQNVGTAHRATRLLDAGNVWINCYGRTDPSLPFGGFKQSGWGREKAEEGISAFLESKSVYTQL
jgi:phenylacetaldehyde dehydrogenase